jgi:hypothetical protein
VNGKIRGLAVLVAALALMAVGPIGAHASPLPFTTSNITVPGSPDYVITTSTSKTIAIAGSTGGTTGDKADILCYYEDDAEAKTLASGVPLAADGSFSLPAVSIEEVPGLCRLRAVPSSSALTTLSGFTGPVLAKSEDFRYLIDSGPEFSDYYFRGQQMNGAFDYNSAGSCGLSDGYLFDAAALEQTTTTWFCDDALYGSDKNKGTRSEVQVDGADAYLRGSADSEAAGYPTLTYSYSQDPVSGDVTIEESGELAECPAGVYPATLANCPEYADTGVRLDRTIHQSDDGLLSIITDRFVSTDGEPHAVDTLPDNTQHFGFSGHPDGEHISYRFPGAEPVVSPAAGEAVSFADGPGTIYVSVEGAADGDRETGRGAIVFDASASPATFTVKYPYESRFHFHQTATVPAGGSATKRFAYAQAYTQAEVEALAHQAEAAFAEPAPVTPTGSSKPTQPSAPPAAAPSNVIRLLGVKLDKKAGTALLEVKVPGPGKLSLSGKKTKTAKRAAKRAGVVGLKVSAKPKFVATLRRDGKLHVALKVTFAPAGGSPRSIHRRLTLLRK